VPLQPAAQPDVAQADPAPRPGALLDQVQNFGVVLASRQGLGAAQQGQGLDPPPRFQLGAGLVQRLLGQQAGGLLAIDPVGPGQQQGRASRGQGQELLLPLPPAQRTVQAARKPETSVRASVHGGDLMGVGREGADALAGGDVPESDRLVPASRQGKAPVRRQGHGADLVGVPLQGPQALPGLQIPEAQDPSRSTGQEVARIGTQRQAIQFFAQILQFGKQASGHEFPDPDRTVHPGRDPNLAVKGQGHGADPALVT